MVLVLLVAVPFIVLEAVALRHSQAQAEVVALSALSSESDEVARAVDDVFSRAGQLLNFLASRSEVRALDARACHSLLAGVTDIDPLYAHVQLLRADGLSVCAATAATADTADTADTGTSISVQAPGFARAMAADGLALGDPVKAGPSQRDERDVAMLTRPVLDPAGRKVGLLALSVDLQRLAAVLRMPGLPPGGTVSVVTQGGIFLTRMPEPQAWIGRPIAEQVREQRTRWPDGVIVAHGADGVERAFVAKAVRHGLRVAVGVPMAPVHAQVRSQWVVDVLIAVLVSLWGGLVAYVGARKLAQPLRSLSSITRRLAAGATDVRADEALPGEFGEMAVEFNRLVAQQQALAESLRQSEAHARRISHFYEALSSTNQAIVRTPQPEALFDEVCRICVASQLADMAWIGRVDGEVLLPMAWGGRAREYTEGLQIALNDQAQQGPTAQAIRSGRPVTSNRYLADASTQAWRERAARFQVRASAAFPFSCEGQVVGALNLYTSMEGYFDDEMVALLETMALDISRALDAAHRQELRAAQQVAEAANRARSLFLSKVSHELRTPLNAIMGFSQLLQLRTRDALGREAQEHLDHIFLASTQLKALIDDVMDLSRIQAGQLALHPKDVQLDRLLEGVAQLCKPQADKAQVQLDVDVSAARALHVSIDPVRLRQMVLNLLTNAIKYNRPQGQVRLSLAVEGETLVITVADTGMGMSPSQLATLCEPFNRLGREDSAIEGTGIGMSLTKQLVDMLEGSMDVRSELDVGTQIVLRLPLRRAEAAPGAPVDGVPGPGPLPTDPPLPTPAEAGGLVLYIEDNPVNAILVQQLLSSLPGVEVMVAVTGAEGILQSRQLRPDLVLLDMHLPDMGGLDVLRRLRSDEATRGLRIVVLSAASLPSDVEAARAAGADDHWHKPIDFVQVLQGVSAVLAAR